MRVSENSKELKTITLKYIKQQFKEKFQDKARLYNNQGLYIVQNFTCCNNSNMVTSMLIKTRKKESGKAKNGNASSYCMFSGAYTCIDTM